MRILQAVAMADPASGGPIESIIQTGKTLRQLGHETEVLCFDAPGASWMKEFPLPLHPLGPYKTSYGYTPKAVPWLLQNASSFDALIVNGLWQYAGTAVRAAANKLNLPYWVYPHGMLDPWFKRRYPLKHLKKLAYWWLREYHVIRDAAAVCFTCEEEKLLARDTFRPYHCNATVVNFGIGSAPGDADAQTKMFHEAFPSLHGVPFILFLSRLHEKKGVDLLLRGYARLSVRSNITPALVIAGPPVTDAYLKFLTDLSRKLGLPTFEHNGAARPPSGPGGARSVHFLPMLAGDLKWGAFRACQAFALPSHQENFGIAVVEALSSGKPVLISNKVNIWREIAASGAGLICDDSDDGVLGAMTKWSETSEDNRREMGSNAKKCFEARFHVKAAAESLLSVLKQGKSPNAQRN